MMLIHHNPKCGTSRDMPAAMRPPETEPAITLYSKTGWTRPKVAGMMPAAAAVLLVGMELTLSGCVVATVAGVAVGVAKTTASAAGTVVETAVDATTQTQQEADEDRGKAARKAEEEAARKARADAQRPVPAQPESL